MNHVIESAATLICKYTDIKWIFLLTTMPPTSQKKIMSLWKETRTEKDSKLLNLFSWAYEGVCAAITHSWEWFSVWRGRRDSLPLWVHHARMLSPNISSLKGFKALRKIQIKAHKTDATIPKWLALHRFTALIRLHWKHWKNRTDGSLWKSGRRNRS